MKTKLFILVLFFLYHPPAHSCSVICGIPSTFDTTSFLMKGKVVGYATHLIGENQEEFGSIEVEVSKSYYAPKKVKKVHLFKLGLSADCRNTGLPINRLEKSYPLGIVITFYGTPSNLVNSQEVYLDIPVCYVLMKGSKLRKKKYRYQKYRKQQHALNVELMRLKEKRSSLPREEYHAQEQKLNKQKSRNYKKLDKWVLPPRLQAHFDLLEIQNAKREGKQYRILSSMLWSQSIRGDDFIEEQVVSKKAKVRLKQKLVEIRQAFQLK